MSHLQRKVKSELSAKLMYVVMNLICVRFELMYVVKHLIHIVMNLMVSIINQKGVVMYLIHIIRNQSPAFSPQTQVRFKKRGVVMKKRQLRQFITEV